MQYRSPGRSGLQVSAIGFGCMSIGHDEAHATTLIHAAMAGGINLFDTADIYDDGHNEILLGQALKGRRQEAIVCTKAGNIRKADGSGLTWDASRKHILNAAEQSLRRLKTDYIDLYQLHGGTIDDPIDDTISAFEQLKQEGKIRCYGISSIRPNVIREYIRRSSIVSVMMQYSLLDRRPEEECLPLLQQHGIGVLSRGALAQGLLGGKPAKDYLSLDSKTVHSVAALVAELSGPTRTPAQTALRFVLQQPGITSAVTGIRTMEQLEEVLGAANAPALNEREMQRLREAAPVTVYKDHR